MLMLLNQVCVYGSSGARSYLPGWQPGASPDVLATIAEIEGAGGFFADDSLLGQGATIARYGLRDPDNNAFLLVAALCFAVFNAGGGGGQTVVNVTSAASPVTAVAGTTYVVDASAGNVVINLPVLTSGKGVTVAQDPSTSLAAHSITINGPASVNLAQPVPSNATFAASYVMSGVESEGMSLTWFNGGSAGGYLLE